MVRAVIAAHLTGSAPDARLGTVTLHAHQRVAVERLRTMLDRHRGALLADDVGLGKTFVALAVADRAADTLVLAPAALRGVWADAAERAGVAVRVVSIESLGRGASYAPAALVIVDEAHHFRSRNTRRYAAARELCATARVLLLSATPVQNSVRDLRSILALFLGERAHAAPMEELSALVVRRLAGDVRDAARLALPAVGEPQWIYPPPDVDCLDRLLALPPPVAPSDGGDGGVLLTYSLVRQWASSRAALRAALTRRLARARALDDALALGRWPSRRELAAWQFADGAQQLTFPELVALGGTVDPAALRQRVLEHADAVRDLSAWLGVTSDPDPARADRLLDVMQRHAGERIVVFSEYADTVTSMFRAQLHRARVAMLTQGGGRVAGGHVSRNDLLAQFGRGPATRDAERVDALICTDVLSEGVDLHAASVVVHLDLSWNPARLEQRVGRLRRIGAARDRVAVYAFAPPAPAERLLRLEHRLRVKLGAAASALGLAGTIVPGLGPTTRRTSPVEHGERIDRLVRSWRTDATTRIPVAGAVRAPVSGALACVRLEGEPRLVAVVGRGVSDSALDVEALAVLADGGDAAVDDDQLSATIDLVRSWMSRRSIGDVIDLPSAHLARARHHVLRRAHAIAQRARRHERLGLREMLGTARSVATATLSAGAERVLDELARAEMPDVAWLQSLGQFAAIHARPPNAQDELLAVLLLRQ